MAVFDDGKDKGALRTIGEVARATGIKAHVLRYWEQQFPMLKPLTRSGGRRYYRPEDIELIERIDRLVNREGYTLKGAKAALRGTPDQQAAAQEPVAAPPSGDLVRRLKAIRDDLKAALAA
ncbi:MerR family transcriptional regulator [Qipengyuania mesophila]|uniref:MerR family transcriptional regulator n=1 Tax=Qipengyuania mesophila TaxID=2867246 RepID=UPI00351421D9